MSKSFELLTCPIDTIEKNYEVLSDTVSEQNGMFIVLQEAKNWWELEHIGILWSSSRIEEKVISLIILWEIIKWYTRIKKLMYKLK